LRAPAGVSRIFMPLAAVRIGPVRIRRILILSAVRSSGITPPVILSVVPVLSRIRIARILIVPVSPVPIAGTGNTAGHMAEVGEFEPNFFIGLYIQGWEASSK